MSVFVRIRRKKHNDVEGEQCTSCVPASRHRHLVLSERCPCTDEPLLHVHALYDRCRSSSEPRHHRTSYVTRRRARNDSNDSPFVRPQDIARLEKAISVTIEPPLRPKTDTYVVGNVMSRLHRTTRDRVFCAGEFCVFLSIFFCPFFSPKRSPDRIKCHCSSRIRNFMIDSIYEFRFKESTRE